MVYVYVEHLQTFALFLTLSEKHTFWVRCQCSLFVFNWWILVKECQLAGHAMFQSRAGWFFLRDHTTSRRLSRTMVATQTRLLVLLSCISLVHNDELRFLVLGDWGGASHSPYTTSYEIAVNKSMSKTADRLGTQFTIALGKERIAWFIYSQKTSWIKRTVRSIHPHSWLILPKNPILIQFIRKSCSFSALACSFMWPDKSIKITLFCPTSQWILI